MTLSDTYRVFYNFSRTFNHKSFPTNESSHSPVLCVEVALEKSHHTVSLHPFYALLLVQALENVEAKFNESFSRFSNTI